MLALVVGAATGHQHHTVQRLLVERPRADRPAVEEVRGHERFALHTLPLPARDVAGGLAVVVAVEQERRGVSRSGELTVERGRAAAIGRRQRYELEAEVSPEGAHGVD